MRLLQPALTIIAKLQLQLCNVSYSKIKMNIFVTVQTALAETSSHSIWIEIQKVGGVSFLEGDSWGQRSPGLSPYRKDWGQSWKPSCHNADERER